MMVLKPFLLIVTIAGQPAFPDANAFGFDTEDDCMAAATLVVGTHSGEIEAACWTITAAGKLRERVSVASRSG
jgi:hypothetical protein